MSVKIPGSGGQVPPLPPMKPQRTTEETTKTKSTAPTGSELKGADWDARGIAARLSILASDAKKKDVDAESFNRIIDEVMQLTGLKNPQAALEEANRKMQKEIEATVDEIKGNADLMDEAKAWQEFAELLEREFTKEQVTEFFGVLKEQIDNIS
jgi:hypothetical protein